jgi:hypothetical protein
MRVLAVDCLPMTPEASSNFVRDMRNTEYYLESKGVEPKGEKVYRAVDELDPILPVKKHRVYRSLVQDTIEVTFKPTNMKKDYPKAFTILKRNLESKGFNESSQFIQNILEIEDPITLSFYDIGEASVADIGLSVVVNIKELGKDPMIEASFISKDNIPVCKAEVARYLNNSLNQFYGQEDFIKECENIAVQKAISLVSNCEEDNDTYSVKVELFVKKVEDKEGNTDPYRTYNKFNLFAI